MEPVTIKLVEEAVSRIAPWVHKTPVLTSASLDRAAGLNIFFKAENFQKTGSFKARGACNAVFRLLEQTKEKGAALPGIVTHSSGNHGQAVAYAAKCAGLPCCVVVPSDTPDVKCQAIQGYGAELVRCHPSPEGRKETAAEIERERKYSLVHPYDDYTVMAGQGTIAYELLEQVPDLDGIVVPISGGGMTAGIAVAAKALKHDCKVYAVEPTGKELGACLAAKERMWPDPPQFLRTIADSIRTQQTGHLTFPILCSLVESKVLTVSDHQMLQGMSLAMSRLKVVVEAASGAGVFAAVHQLKEVDPSIKKVGVILCGGNTGFTPLPQMHLEDDSHSPEAE